MIPNTYVGFHTFGTKNYFREKRYFGLKLNAYGVVEIFSFLVTANLKALAV
jgi:hypothetical protein